ncbi:hypothetical protein THAOC_11157 [Thalassiosira oceanica]|uniref:Uncharacterized protein n=1 Tax=Thalassiosira oceanica TaxID=159749 RepID=K0SNE3_THAOC|nr:hypothetical protein THAOC_11157 [Thalassiosira oceanica]|eukprot:EJK67768.1 hypothetical protein THAOC_11157 [Thalassiosira oceanica]
MSNLKSDFFQIWAFPLSCFLLTIARKIEQGLHSFLKHDEKVSTSILIQAAIQRRCGWESNSIERNDRLQRVEIHLHPIRGLPIGKRRPIPGSMGFSSTRKGGNPAVPVHKYIFHFGELVHVSKVWTPTRHKKSLHLQKKFCNSIVDFFT